MESHSVTKKKKMLHFRRPLFASDRNRGNYHRIIDHSIVLCCCCLVELILLVPSECIPQITGQIILKANVLYVTLFLLVTLVKYLWNIYVKIPTQLNKYRKYVANKGAKSAGAVLFQRRGKKVISVATICQCLEPTHFTNGSLSTAATFCQIFTRQGHKPGPEHIIQTNGESRPNILSNSQENINHNKCYLSLKSSRSL